ncbi:MAG: hypothetical protein QM214_02155 [Bacillota bacterium]|nr:hypothetical protein [Bacillota bacterium]
MRKIKIAIVFGLIIALASVFVGCGPIKVSDEIWDNQNAVYVDIDPEYVTKVFDKWEKAFSDLGLKAVFITKKTFNGAYDNEDPALTLLLVLKKGGAEKQAAAVEKLKADKRVLSARIVDDVPFEPINTLHFEEEEIQAKVGDTITLAVSGESMVYEQRFSFESIFPIVLKDYDKEKTYTPEDFPNSGASSIKEMNLSYADYLQLSLETPGYFNAIKAVHAVAQNANVLAVMLTPVIGPAIHFPDRWFVSDTTLAEITNLKAKGTGYYDGKRSDGQRVAAEVLCNQAGTFTVTFTQSLGNRMGGSATCTIIVEEP